MPVSVLLQRGIVKLYGIEFSQGPPEINHGQARVDRRAAGGWGDVMTVIAYDAP
ncbi:MAG: hypothetical protein ACKVP2_06845 [Burkholderiales bacterium]